MVYRARYSQEPKADIIEGHLVTINRGEFIFGRKSWSKRLGISEQRLRTLIKKLLEDEMIEVVKKYNKFTHYKIINYEKYNQQDNQQLILENTHIENNNNQHNNQQLTTSQPPTNHQPTTKEQRSNNDNNDNKNIYSKIPYQKIIDLYNNTCNSLPKIQKTTDKRKKTIKTRWTQYSDIGIYEKLFNKAENSDFLSGRNGKWTSCNFDWLLNENNMIKVLEGNYDNKESVQTVNKKTRFHTENGRTSNYTPDELEEIARKRRANS